MPQKEQGCKPSKEHMIFPQLRQFGAGSNSGCSVAEHAHFRLSVLKLGLVDTSNAAIAAVRSVILFVVSAAPFFDVLAFTLCFCLLVFDLTFGSISESTGPEAEGGGLEDVGKGGIGDWGRDDTEELGAERAGVRADEALLDAM